VNTRPTVSPLSAADEAEIARAVAKGPGPETAFQTLVTAGRRRLCVTAIRAPEVEDAWLRWSAVVSRRAEAGANRLLPVAATGDFDGCHWIAYEVGSATSLASERRRRWPVEPCLALLFDVAHGLDEAGADGLLPYELRPESIFIDERFGALLGDFGSAREAFGAPPAGDGREQIFVPPEVLRGEGAGERSGVYACGVLLYQLLTGGPPRPGPLTRWRSDAPDAIDLVVARGMARDSLERYASATEFCERARRALLDDPAGPAPARAEPPAPNGDRPPAGAPAARPSGALFSAPLSEEEAAAFAPAADYAADAAELTVDRSATDDTVDVAVGGATSDALDDEAFARATRPADQVPERDYDWRLPESRFGRPLRAAVVLSALVLGAFAGLQLGSDSKPAEIALADHPGARGLSVTLPPGWSGGIADDEVALSAYPSADGFSGLTVALEDATILPEERSDPVRLGKLDLWRDASEAPRRIRYVAPTTAGKLVIVCEASPSAARNTLRLCERSASTLRLRDARVLALPGVADEPGVRAAVARLRSRRRAGRRRLAQARLPSGQRKVARALDRLHERAARSLAALPEGEAIAAAAGRTGRAYATLAQAAGSGKRARWNAARDRVRSAEADLADAIASGG
jgi:hypothetical protein